MPETFKVLAPFAANLRLSAPVSSEGWECEMLASSMIRQANETTFFDVPELWWRAEGELRLSALTKKLQRWLQSQKLPASDEIVKIMLGMIAVRVLDGVDLVSILKEMREAVRSVDVVQIHMLPDDETSEWSGSLEWGGFRLGALDGSKLVYRCRKAKSVRFEAQAREMDAVKSIHSPSTKRALVDWSDVCWKVRSSNIKRYGPTLLEYYHHYCSNIFATAMWSELEDVWLLPQALGLHYFNIRDFERMPGGNTWTILSGLGPSSVHSWIGTTANEKIIRLVDLEKTEATVNRLADRYHFSALPNSSLFPLIRSMSRSLVRSTSHMIGDRVDESFLFLIIAIEQVFSEKQNTTQAVVSRTALVAHRFLKLNYKDAEKKVARLYDGRSKLVHAGESVTPEYLLEANDLGEAVLKCLLRLACGQPALDQNLHESWLKRLDYLVAGIEAGKPPSDADLIENGIIHSPTP
jgi:hypothetical protein